MQMRPGNYRTCGKWRVRFTDGFFSWRSGRFTLRFFSWRSGPFTLRFFGWGFERFALRLRGFVVRRSCGGRLARDSRRALSASTRLVPTPRRLGGARSARRRGHRGCARRLPGM